MGIISNACQVVHRDPEKHHAEGNRDGLCVERDADPAGNDPLIYFHVSKTI